MKKEITISWGDGFRQLSEFEFELIEKAYRNHWPIMLYDEQGIGDISIYIEYAEEDNEMV